MTGRIAYETPLSPATADAYAEDAACCRRRLRIAREMLQRALWALDHPMDERDRFPALRSDLAKFLEEA
jgi:hypothetical protein